MKGQPARSRRTYLERKQRRSAKRRATRAADAHSLNVWLMAHGGQTTLPTLKHRKHHYRRNIIDARGRFLQPREWFTANRQRKTGTEG